MPARKPGTRTFAGPKKDFGDRKSFGPKKPFGAKPHRKGPFKPE